MFRALVRAIDGRDELMNILFFSELFYPHGGGAEFATYLYATHLSKFGFNVTVITNQFGDEPATFLNRNLHIYRLPLFTSKTPNKYSTFFRPDVIFLNFIKKLILKSDIVYVPRFWYSVIPLAKLFKKPVVVHLHDYIPVCPLSNLYNFNVREICERGINSCSSKCIYAWEKMRGRNFSETIYSLFFNSTIGKLWGQFIKFCDAIVCVSNAQAKFIKVNAPLLYPKIQVIYNPLPKISHVKIGDSDFAYFGGPNYLKGFHVLYEAVRSFNYAKNKKINVHITNFSSTSACFINKLVKFGFVPYGKLNFKKSEELYRKLKCVVVPSICPETFSYVTIEALLRGRLVIASNIGAIPEVTAGCKGVFLFPPSNVCQLIEKMNYVANVEKDELIDLSLRNRAILAKKFDSRNIAKAFTTLLYDTFSNSV